MRKLLDATLVVAATTIGAARHVAWYVAYHAGGDARSDEPRQRS